MEKDNEIDQLFKRGLNDPEIPFNELDWEKMERKLDAQKKKRILPLWIYTAGGIAAALMIFLSWFFLSPVSNQQHTQTTLASRHVKPGHKSPLPLVTKEIDTAGLGQSNLAGQENLADQNNEAVLLKPLPVTPATEQAVQFPEQIKSAGKTSGSNQLYTANQPILSGSVPANNSGIFAAGPKGLQTAPELSKMPGDRISAPVNAAQVAVLNTKPHQILPETDSARVIRTANALAQSKDPLQKLEQTEIERSVKKKMEATLQPRDNNLVLSAMAAPDISSAKDSRPSKVSSDVGMVASYPLWHNVSISSGAIYSKKYYNYGSGNYGDTQQGTLTNADCNVLDVPLNVNYKLMNKKQLSVSMTAGVSSYFMLKEKYDYTTGSVVSQNTIYNQNQHIFGVANLGVSFDHQISQSVSIGVQPFAKLPLTGIGEHDANLKSVGMFFSLNIGLFGPKKPGKYASLWK